MLLAILRSMETRVCPKRGGPSTRKVVRSCESLKLLTRRARPS